MGPFSRGPHDVTHEYENHKNCYEPDEPTSTPKPRMYNADGGFANCVKQIETKKMHFCYMFCTVLRRSRIALTCFKHCESGLYSCRLFRRKSSLSVGGCYRVARTRDSFEGGCYGGRRRSGGCITLRTGDLFDLIAGDITIRRWGFGEQIHLKKKRCQG